MEIMPSKVEVKHSSEVVEFIMKRFYQGKLVDIRVSPPPDTKINPLQIYRNTWYQGLDDGFVIPLSRDRECRRRFLPPP